MKVLQSGRWSAAGGELRALPSGSIHFSILKASNKEESVNEAINMEHNVLTSPGYRNLIVGINFGIEKNMEITKT